MRGARILHASDGIQLFGSKDPPVRSSISQTVFDAGSYAMIIQRGTVDIDGILVTSGPAHGVWISALGATEVRISNSVFRSVYNPIVCGRAFLRVVNCTIDRGHTGITMTDTGGGVEIVNTLITNGAEAVAFQSASSEAPLVRLVARTSGRTRRISSIWAA